MRLIKLKVFPGSKKDIVEVRGADSFAIKVRAPAEDGRANDSAISLIADYLGVSSSKLRLVKGHRSRSKILEMWE
ncbi:MAG: DUF167 domain-containing protein [Candidatus Colwellbacteria bacterium]|nr:DUF167 domain-containing protein [Candidatus Colwellbacteria bacterium]